MATRTATKRNNSVLEPDLLIRSKRKTLSISIDSLGRLVVRAPISCSRERILYFIQRKASWIEKEKSKAKIVDLPTPKNLNGYTLPFLGDRTTISLYEGGQVRFEPTSHTLYVPQKNGEKRLVAYFKKEALCLVNALVEKWKKVIKSPKSIAIGSAKTAWGSCSSSGKLRFSFRLIYCPKEVIEYVVVHELCHLIECNHSPRFWKGVERVLPTYQTQKAWLKENRYLMQIF